MWEVVWTMLGMMVLLFLYSLLPYIFDLPESIAKYFGGRFHAADLEKRVRVLEAHMRELRGAGAGKDDLLRKEPGGATGITNQMPRPRLAWDARFDATRAIGDQDTRDETFAILAREAAEACELGVVHSALGEIKDADQRDETTCNCSLILARAGKSTEAVALAKTVSDGDQRDETLAQLAAG